VVTNSKNIYQRLKLLRSHGRQENAEGYFSTTKELDYIELGYNFRLPTICAALVLSQLKKIQKIITIRREKAIAFTKQLSPIKQITTPTVIKNHFSVYQMYTIQFNDQKTRDSVQNHLTKAGVMTKVYFEPVHLKTFYKKQFKYKPGNLPKTEHIATKVLTLPLYPTLTDTEIGYITDTIKNCCR
ncbi:MAG: DegT/DnrJ/EryC1/StrS family aminotransferase, partial [Candidatus Thermoplasmatota archaeon]